MRLGLPILVGAGLLAGWWIAWETGQFPVGTVPSPEAVARGFVTEASAGRLTTDIVASLYRVGFGYVGACAAAIPLGLLLGRSLRWRAALLPWINFFRTLSPIAWIPFAAIWFGIGDPPALFIIFMATFFQVVLATAGAAGQVPRIYYRVAEDLGMGKAQMLFQVTLPAILPQLLVTLRVAIGVAWMVVVAAEMLGMKSGLGFLISDGRNGLRMDLVVVAMITIGVIGVALDSLFARLARAPMVRWGSER